MATRPAALSEGEIGPSFEEEWPELARRLERFLAAQSVDRWLRADVIQETAARLYPRWEKIDHSVPLWNLVVTIALNIVSNHRRKDSRIELVPDPIEIHADDVQQRALQRAQLDKTRSALQQLTADQRRVLLAEVGEALSPTGTRNRINVLRLRARANLREALGPWAPSAITIRLRYLRARVADKKLALDTHMPAMAGSIANAAVAATLALGASGTGVDATNPAPPEHTALVSVAELRDRDRGRSIGPETDDLSRAKEPSKNDHASGPASGESTGGLSEWAARRKEEVGARGQEVSNLAEDGRNLAEDGGELGEDARDVGEEWAEGRKEEAGDRGEEVVCAVSQEDC